MSRTGSGKTAAFIVPMLQVFDDLKQPSTKGVRAVLISPTRELALQTAQFLKEVHWCELNN
jgi:ATP-dependent RNA helicase DDX54/DBP10